MSDEFSNVVLVGQAAISADGRLTSRYKINIESC